MSRPWIASALTVLVSGCTPARSMAAEAPLVTPPPAAPRPPIVLSVVGINDHSLERGGTLDGSDPKWFDPRRPRMSLPSPRPVRCEAEIS